MVFTAYMCVIQIFQPYKKVIDILCNSVGWKVLWPTQHAAEEGSICGCSGDRPDRCRVTPGCLYIKTIGSPDLYFYNVPVCHSVEIMGKKHLAAY